jgi:predicted ATPase/DNA-binding SARP family transcriptional activator
LRQIAIALLGPFAVKIEGKVVTEFKYAKVRALLAYLVMESHRPWTRTALATLLWPNQSDRVARGNLSQALTTLRKALDDKTSDQSLLLADAETVQLDLDSSFEVDVKQFLALLQSSEAHPHPSWRTCTPCAERLRQAMDLYQDNFLTDFFIPDSSVFEEWASLQREYLRQRALSALDRLVAWAQWRGAYVEAIEYARRQVTLEPLLEVNHRVLIRLLALNGEVSAALAHHQYLQQLLAEELGIEPEAATTELFDQIRGGDTAGLQSPSIPFVVPVPPVPLIGRTSDLQLICTRLQDPHVRALTITGTGGIGKTRLALEAAHTMRYDFEDGVYFIDLTSLNDAALVIDAIAQLLEVKERPGRRLSETLQAHLRSKHLLLILDNFEHVGAAAPLIAELLTTCPALKVLVTSREPLTIRAEWQLALEPLSNKEAVQLFLHCARVAGAGWTADGDNISLYDDICFRLDGLPLAVELIAARARTLSPSDMLHQLERPLQVLINGPGDVPKRHQTLRNTIQWSYDLLNPPEQRVFVHLGLFAGGCSIEAAQVVLGELNSALPALETLHQASLLQQQVIAGETRFVMLGTLREFALEQLLALGKETNEARRRHAEYFARLAMTAYTELLSSEGARWLAKLTAEQDNIRLAFWWAMDQGYFELALQLATGVWRFHWMRGFLREGLERLETALVESALAPLELRSQAMRAAGTLAMGLSDYVRARQWLEQAVEVGRWLPDLSLVQAALTNLGFVLFEQGEVESANFYLEESLAMARRNDNPCTIKFPLGLFGSLHFRLGNFAQARAYYEESLRLNRACQDTEGIATGLRGLGQVVNAQGNSQYARQLAEEAMALHCTLNHQLGMGLDYSLFGAIAQGQGNYAEALQQYKCCLTLWMDRENIVNSAFVLDDIAQTLSWMGEPARAVKLMGAAAAIRKQAKVKLTAYEEDNRETILALCRTSLGDEEFTSAWVEGQALTLEQAISLALEQVG